MREPSPTCLGSPNSTSIEAASSPLGTSACRDRQGLGPIGLCLLLATSTPLRSYDDQTARQGTSDAPSGPSPVVPWPRSQHPTRACPHRVTQAQGIAEAARKRMHPGRSVSPRRAFRPSDSCPKYFNSSCQGTVSTENASGHTRAFDAGS